MKYKDYSFNQSTINLLSIERNPIKIIIIKELYMTDKSANK